jgi:hypothetical protein
VHGSIRTLSVGFVRQLFQFHLATPDQRMIVRVAQGFEGNNGVEDAGENRGQAVAALKALDHPFLGLFQWRVCGRDGDCGGQNAPRTYAAWSSQRKEIAPGKKLRIARQHQVALVKAEGIKFVQGALGSGCGWV